MPAFDVYYDEKTGYPQFDRRYRSSTNIEMGQLTHTNNDCNENFKLVLVRWRDAYREMVSGNKLPVFFDMEQSANVVAFASWYLTPKVDEDGITEIDVDGNVVNVVSCAKNPIHILSIERIGTSPSEYNFTEYSSNAIVNGSGIVNDWVFDRYQYCQADGTLLIPFYKFNCQDSTPDSIEGEYRLDPEDDDFIQTVGLRMFLVPAQTLKLQNYAANDQLIRLDDVEIDLNKKVDFMDDKSKYLFDYPIEVCRNTNFVFSTYVLNGMNRIKCAFLGVFAQGQEDDTYKVGIAGAKTRYEFDSKSEVELGQLKSRYFKGRSEDWNPGFENEIPVEDRKYIDMHILGTEGDPDDPDDDIKPAFNSYDSNDKYVFVLDFKPSIDNKTLFDMGVKAADALTALSYNILGDAGYIPHFAYQSLVKYGDKDGGIAYTWTSKYLYGKDHLQFELLGLDDKAIPELYENMRKLIVRDVTDNCDTLICPGRFMDDIYRIWCEEKGVGRLYFANEFKDVPNPKLDFNVDGDGSTIEWELWKEDSKGAVITDDLFEIELPRDVTDLEGIDEEAYEAAFRDVLDDYYVYVMRTENGEILNEKRYLLKPTSLAELIYGTDENEWTKCNLSKYQTPLVQDNHYVRAQVVFTGTPDPFNYDTDGRRIYSKPEELQYGNSVCGVGSIELKVEIVSKKGEVFARDEKGNLALDENGLPVKKTILRKWLKPTVRFKKYVSDPKKKKTLVDMIQESTKDIQQGQVTVMFSHKNFDNIAKYHILNRTSNLYFDGSLTKNKKNQFKYSDFKFERTVHVEEYTV